MADSLTPVEMDQMAVDLDTHIDAEEMPTRLLAGSIGGLKTRRPQDKLPFLNAMIYGDSGSGKTLLTGTAAFVPELSPVLLIDVEGGTHSLSHFDDTSDIEIVPDPNEGRTLRWTDLQKIYDDLYRGKHPFKTVILDSATEMQKLHMGTALGAGSGGRVDIDAIGSLPEFKDWHVNTESMRRMMRAFRDLPMNTIFTALTDTEVDPRTAKSENPRMLKVPSFTKKLKQEVPAFFDAVFYLYSKARGAENIRYIQTDKDNSVVAKCRVRGVPVTIENPTMEMLYDMLIRNPNTDAPATIRTGAGGGMKRR